MQLTALEIAQRVGGELRGDPGTVVDAVAPLDRAGPRHVSFLASGKYERLVRDSNAGVVLIPPEMIGAAQARSTVGAWVVVRNPHEAIVTLLASLYDTSAAAPWVAPTARLGRGVQLGERVRIEEYVVLGDGVRVGDDTRLYPHVVLYSGTEVGARCIVHSGVRLGSDGFGYNFLNGAHTKIPHVGRCVVGDDVEIGANSTIDRGSVDDTVIGAGTKIDNLVHIAHNVRVGRGCLIMAQVGIAGSVRVGDHVILAGQVGVSGHLTIGDRARVAAQAGVFGDIPAGETWSGYPARPHRESLRASAALFRISRMMRGLEQLLDGQERA